MCTDMMQNYHYTISCDEGFSGYAKVKVWFDQGTRHGYHIFTQWDFHGIEKETKTTNQMRPNNSIWPQGLRSDGGKYMTIVRGYMLIRWSGKNGSYGHSILEVFRGQWTDSNFQPEGDKPFITIRVNTQDSTISSVHTMGGGKHSFRISMYTTSWHKANRYKEDLPGTKWCSTDIYIYDGIGC